MRSIRGQTRAGIGIPARLRWGGRGARWMDDRRGMCRVSRPERDTRPCMLRLAGTRRARVANHRTQMRSAPRRPRRPSRTSMRRTSTTPTTTLCASMARYASPRVPAQASVTRTWVARCLLLPTCLRANVALQYFLNILIRHPYYEHISPSGAGLTAECPVWYVVGDRFAHAHPPSGAEHDLTALPVNGSIVPVGPDAVRAPVSIGAYTQEKRPTSKFPRILNY
ncbi:hypothetical protein DFH08DRAFT_240806 [Mycena albidolilacea]|uniref:Uncharacterized protein n=1 Tax=Mycena albidolilacea TaxID=1033008 RepID=A0AAD6ZWX9_9AGAR|nr:hypothetical protein DFH08DRAFT_240806 [Mycena albidolilacea]